MKRFLDRGHQLKQKANEITSWWNGCTKKENCVFVLNWMKKQNWSVRFFFVIFVFVLSDSSEIMADYDLILKHWGPVEADYSAHGNLVLTRSVLLSSHSDRFQENHAVIHLFKELPTVQRISFTHRCPKYKTSFLKMMIIIFLYYYIPNHKFKWFCTWMLS